jgi:hypothetical protein
LVVAVNAVEGSVTALPAKVVPQVLDEVDKQATALQTRLDGQLTKLEKDTTRIVTDGVGKADARVGETLKIADTRIGDSLKRVDDTLDVLKTVQSDLKPVLVNSADLIKDAKDSWDSNYYDVVSLLNSAEVATTSVAQASEAMRDAAPKVATSVVSIGQSVDGIAADAHQLTQDIVKPQSLWGKVKAILESAGKIAVRLI